MASSIPKCPLLLLFLCGFIFTSHFVLPSSASPVIDTATYPRFPEFSGAGHTPELSFGIRLNSYEGNSTTLVLAEERTRRKDPLNDFRPYTGGFNISSEHYWASVSATAAPFFLVAGVWFVVFGISLVITCICFCCCGGDSYGYSRVCYALSLIFLIIFTVAAIVGCVVLYTGQGKFYSITSDTLDYVVSQADVTAESLRNVSGYLSAAKSVGVESFFLPADMQGKLDSLVAKANSSGTALSSRTQDNRETIIDGLNGVLVILGWIIVAGTFILCGVFLLLHNVVGDTCVAMDEWVQHPTAKTAMDDFIPCVDNATAQETLLQSKQVTFQLSNMVDNVLSNFSNHFNQSGLFVPLLCNPFNPDLTDRSCAAGEVDLSNATEAWKEYVCQASESGICTTTGRLTPALYAQMASAVNVSYGLSRYGPFLVELEDCTFVRRTFTDINASYCPKLGRYTQWIYVGLVIVSAAVMLSLILWVVYARERRHRVYTKQFITRQHDNKGRP
ncbi:hypothetical protein LINPERPRIM_LOCUS30859 [Linum perenne]